MDTVTPVAPEAPSEAAIEALVSIFYDRVRADPVLGPLFDKAIADWDAHSRTVVDFWSAVLRGSGRYSGCVFGAHAGLPMQAEHFTRWLDAFRVSAAETLPPAAAARAVTLSEGLAQAMQR
jgi:hemoglobin